MIEINLLPDSSPGRESGLIAGRRAGPGVPAFVRADPWRAGLLVTALVVLIATLGSVWQTTAAIQELESRLEQEIADSVRHSSAISSLAALRAEQDTIQVKIGTIRRFDERRYVWPRVLDEISRATPTAVWLIRLASTELPDSVGGPSFTLDGVAATTEILIDFMKYLEASTWVRDVTLLSTQQASRDGQSVQQFSLQAHYKGAGPDPGRRANRIATDD